MCMKTQYQGRGLGEIFYALSSAALREMLLSDNVYIHTSCDFVCLHLSVWLHSSLCVHSRMATR